MDDDLSLSLRLNLKKINKTKSGQNHQIQKRRSEIETRSEHKQADCKPRTRQSWTQMSWMLSKQLYSKDWLWCRCIYTLRRRWNSWGIIPNKGQETLSKSSDFDQTKTWQNVFKNGKQLFFMKVLKIWPFKDKVFNKNNYLNTEFPQILQKHLCVQIVSIYNQLLKNNLYKLKMLTIKSRLTWMGPPHTMITWFHILCSSSSSQSLNAKIKK